MRCIVTFLAVVVLVGCASQSRHSTQPQIAAPIEALPNPFSPRIITVVLTNPIVWVSGEVMQPGRITWTPDLTLTNAIALSGGFTDFANKRWLEIRRSYWDGTNTQARSIQVVGIATNGILLERGDFVQVRRRGLLW